MRNLILFIVVILLILIGLSFFLQNSEPAKPDGQVVNDPEPIKQKYGDEVKLTNFKNNDLMSSPFTMLGEVRGNWYFEANLRVELYDADGKLLVQSPGTAEGEWMTDKFVPFKAELKFLPTTDSGKLRILNDNPSGLPANEKFVDYAVRFQSVETMKVKVFFNNNNLDPEISCNKVFPVERTIAKTQSVAKAALMELLDGVKSAESASGYYSNINDGVKLNKITIESGVAKADFDEQLQYQVGGSCRVSAIRAQITETLKQFPTVSSVVISINGETETILQP